ncbi:hypothetical protein [Methanobrevibacter sp. DSM 116169]|uniref:hypothetical protein n=1 Tax=Methanobrevibacter sp. DSM 116169 TaxID=3242727 RepID=UPI0038FC5BB8
MEYEEKDFELKIPNGVGEQMLAHTIEKFDVKLEHGEYGPKLIGKEEELLKAHEYMIEVIQKRLKELE